MAKSVKGRRQSDGGSGGGSGGRGGGVGAGYGEILAMSDFGSKAAATSTSDAISDGVADSAVEVSGSVSLHSCMRFLIACSLTYSCYDDVKGMWALIKGNFEYVG